MKKERRGGVLNEKEGDGGYPPAPSKTQKTHKNMKAYQLIFITAYDEYDEGFRYEQTEAMPGPVFLHKEKAEEERRRILRLPYEEQEKLTTRFSGFLSEIKIKEWEIIE